MASWDCHSRTEIGHKRGERATDWVTTSFIPIHGLDVIFYGQDRSVGEMSP